MIGKTRQQSPPKAPTTQQSDVEEFFDPEVGAARGMLRRPLAAGKMRHARRSPANDLVPWVAHYWMIQWDLRGCDPHVAESLPHPNIHLIFEPTGVVVAGVHTSKFSRVIEGESQVFGVKFKPGGFRPFAKFAASKVANRMVPASNIFGMEVDELRDLLLSSFIHNRTKEDRKVEAVNTFLRARMPRPDKTSESAVQLVDRILGEREIKTVDDLVSRTGIGKRFLQRLFNEYVGVSPKWVIRRYRLHELVERFNAGDEPDWADLALDLGYFDQAHLINDFHSITGLSPTQYRELVRKDGARKEIRDRKNQRGM